MLIPDPLILISQPAPFDDPEWIYEIKHDGFRALAVIERGHCRFFHGRNIGSPVIGNFGKPWLKR